MDMLLQHAANAQRSLSLTRKLGGFSILQLPHPLVSLKPFSHASHRQPRGRMRTGTTMRTTAVLQLRSCTAVDLQLLNLVAVDLQAVS